MSTPIHLSGYEQVAEAASRLALYFGTALPLHEEDEEKTLHLAMAQYAISDIDALFARLEAEHRTIEAILHRLLPRWRILARTPDVLIGESGVLGEGAAALAAAFMPHLEMEENELYPLARRCLPDDVQARMLRAMRGRREPMIDRLHSLHENQEIRS